MTRGVRGLTIGYRARVLAAFLLVGVVFASAWAWSLYGPLADEVLSRQEEYLTGIARSAAVAAALGPDEVQSHVERMAEGAEYRITVIAADGTVLADSDEDPATLDNHGDRPEVRAALDGRTGTDIRHSETQDVDRMYVAIPSEIDQEPVAVRASTSLERLQLLTDRARQAGLGLLALALFLSAFAAWRLSRSVARPVEELADAAHAMAEGDLSSPVPATDRSLAPLSDALARLAGQMRERIGALDAERQTLRLVLDGLSDGVLLVEDGRVALVNRALLGMFRLPPVDARGRALGDLGLPASVLGAIEQNLTHAESAVVEVGPDPYRRSHRLLVLPLGSTPPSTRRLVVIADTTERARVEQMRRDFVANASHELKTPTAGILLLASSANQAARDGDVTQALAFVSQIEAEAQHLSRLVADLLDLSRLEAAPSGEEVTDVRRAIELALAGHRRAASAKGLEIETDVSAVAGEDVAVRVEATDLTVILDNLLSNAIAYTERGRIAIRLVASPTDVEIAIADTGVGIPTGDLERVFERFYRVDRARSRTSGGTGLGLSLVRNAVERADGTVTISSERGRGTTVTVMVPRAV